ncbi:MAG TPA: glycosyltransferase family 2 protein [Vicinamibacteria bacterium]|nr:glycosyltransferase family 2 protein [Vicinamibacteria bacterium]
MASAAPTSLGIVVVSFNSRRHLTRCLQSIRDHAPGCRWEVVVVDNASSDGSADMVAAEFPWVRLIRSPTNDGYGVAANKGVRELDTTHVLLLNPDAEVTPGALDALLAFALAHPRAGVVGPRLLLGDGQPQPSARRFLSPALMLVEALRLHLLLPRRHRGRLMLGTYFPQDVTLRVPWVSGACHLVPRAAWDRIGPLTEDTFCGFDDYDYCHRAWRAGHEVWLFAEAVVVHHCSVAVRDRWSAWQVEELAVHNTYVVIESHWPWWRVKLFGLAELTTWIMESARHAVRPRANVAHLDEPYGARLRRRLGLTTRLLLGRETPRKRFEPRPAAPTARPAG